MATAIPSPLRATHAEARGIALVPMYWHLLSLDAPCVAALWTVFLSHACGVALPWTVPAALGVAVWMLYALDRLGDAARVTQPLAERHRFHHNHRLALTGAVIGCVPLLGLLIVLLPHALRTGWLLLALPLGVYVLAVHGMHLRRVPKEPLVGLFFACATAVPAVAAHVRVATIIPMMVAFGVVCWLNCAAIARWEHSDGLDALTNFAARHFGAAVLAATFTSACILPIHPAVSIACIMSLLALGLLDTRQNPNPVLQRALADAALLTPLLVWPTLHFLGMR